MYRAIAFMLVFTTGCGTAYLIRRTPGPPRAGIVAYTRDRDVAVEEMVSYCRGKGYRVLAEGEGEGATVAGVAGGKTFGARAKADSWIEFECRD